MKITNPDEYRRALSRISELQEQGASVQNSREFASLEAEVARYASQENEPDESKGRPPLSGSTNGER